VLVDDSEVVRRYTNLVYSVAKRRLSNTALAQDATQTVFIRLAKAAPNIRGDAELVAWLHRTTVNASIDLWRSESRRRAREEHAVAMQSDRTESPVWNEIAPAVDEALNPLNPQERQVLLLRFFEQKSMREVGLLLGISEDAAKMRVSRAMDRLRLQFREYGVTCALGTLGAVLATRSVEAAPSGLVISLASIRIPAAVGVGIGIGGLLWHVSKAKFLAGIAAALLITIAAVIWLNSSRSSNRDTGGSMNRGRVVSSGLAVDNQNADRAVGSDTIDPETQGQPDPTKLLEGVVRARQRIFSGSMDFQVSSHWFGQNEPGTTNQSRLKAFFEGEKRRFESFTREYSYVSIGQEGSEADAAKIRELGLDREGAVRAGLMRGFASHHVIIYDGASEVLDYWENDTEQPRTTIDLPGRSPEINFDPRCLGLRAWISITYTLENCLPYRDAKSIRLEGKESIDGIPAWHIRVESKYGESLEFWIDVTHPFRVLKFAQGTNIALSIFDRASQRDVIPVEVITKEFRNGSPLLEGRIVLSNAQFNVSTDHLPWTLAGLGMRVGTSVIDARNMRQLGYWNGTGLSEDLPSKTEQPQSPPDRAELLALLDNDPASTLSLEAAQWIISNTPDGKDVEKAGAVILQEHIRSTNLVLLCELLERVRPRCSTNLLRAVLDKNPFAEVRGAACLALATLRRDDAKFGKNKQALADAEKLYERTISDFGKVKNKNGNTLAELAKPELSDLRRLTIGKPAPDTEGIDLDGQKMKLSDYRGKVVVLVIWGGCGGCRPDVPPLRSLLQRLADKPFAVIGLYCDNEPTRAKTIADSSGMTWRSFVTDRNGSIASTWHVIIWPQIYILDGKGVIRFRGFRGDEMNQVVEALLRE